MTRPSTQVVTKSPAPKMLPTPKSMPSSEPVATNTAIVSGAPLAKAIRVALILCEMGLTLLMSMKV
jgi:hypothetical protein